MLVRDDTLNHHFCHCLALFFTVAIVCRLVTLAESKGLIDAQFSFNFSLGCFGLALIYWVFWMILNIEEITPKAPYNPFSNHKPRLIDRTNLVEVTYRVLALLSILAGFILGSI